MTGDEAANFLLKIVIWIAGGFATVCGWLWFVASGARGRADKAQAQVERVQQRLGTIGESVEALRGEHKETRAEITTSISKLGDRIDRAIETWAEKK